MTNMFSHDYNASSKTTIFGGTKKIYIKNIKYTK